MKAYFAAGVAFASLCAVGLMMQVKSADASDVWETCIPRQCSQTVETFSSLEACAYFLSTRQNRKEWIDCRTRK